MLEGVPGLLTYLFLKMVGYTLWSYVGLRWFDPKRSSFASGAVGRGVGRVVVGWITGIMVAPFALVAIGTNHLPLFYFTALVVVRWFEWGVIQFSIPSPESGAGVFLHGASQRGREWRIIGILVSYLADAPFLIAGGGFPHGRLFC
jgi:hypothetical protein